MSHVTVEIEKPEEVPLISSLGNELSSLPALSRNHCIYEVPQRLRGDGSLYTPKIVSIGPIHHGRQGLGAMEEHKRRFLADFLRRTGVKLEDYVAFVKDREARLRECYADGIDIQTDKLTKIFVVDAAFLVELLLKQAARLHDDSCRIFGRSPGMKVDIMGDLILLENQLPVFILEDIFDYWIKGRGGIEEDITTLVCRLIDYRSDMRANGYDIEKVRNSKPVHILDCLRICHTLAGSEDPALRGRELAEHLSIHSVIELHQAGLKFRRSPSPSLFSIKFEGGILMVPCMKIGSGSETIYRNLLAFEQCHYPTRDYIFSDFFTLMDRLVNTSQDIDLLVEKGIIMLTLGDSGEAADVFNRLSQGLVTFNTKYFAGVYRDLTTYYERPWNRWKASLNQKYFNTPWAAISVGAAAFLLVLTLIQTVFSIVN